MRITRKLFGTLSVLLALMLLAASCGSSDSAGSDSAGSDSAGSDSAGSDASSDGETATTEAPADDEADASDGESASGETTSIRYLTFSAAPDHLEDLDAMIAGFEAENPDVSVEVETLPYDDYFSVLRTQIAGDDAPDAFEVNYENFVSFAAAGTLADLGELTADTDTSAYYQRAYEAFSLDGKQYALPASYSTVVLFFNKELFDEAGLDYPTDDWTWEDEKNAAAELTALGDDVYGFFGGIQFFEFFKTAAQNGCEILDGGAVTIDEPECVEALQFMLDYVDSGSQPSEAQMAGLSDGEMFVNGELGMITTGIWMFDQFSEAGFDWDIAREPGGSEGGSHFFANGAAVSATSDNAEAAARWITYLTSSPDAAKIRVDASWELPTLTDASLYDSYLAQDPPANREAVLSSLENVVLPPVIERQEEMQAAVDSALASAVAGDLTAAEALAQAKAEIEPLLN